MPKPSNTSQSNLASLLLPDSSPGKPNIGRSPRSCSRVARRLEYRNPQSCLCGTANMYASTYYLYIHIYIYIYVEYTYTHVLTQLLSYLDCYTCIYFRSCSRFIFVLLFCSAIGARCLWPRKSNSRYLGRPTKLLKSPQKHKNRNPYFTLIRQIFSLFFCQGEEFLSK